MSFYYRLVLAWHSTKQRKTLDTTIYAIFPLERCKKADMILALFSLCGAAVTHPSGQRKKKEETQSPLFTSSAFDWEFIIEREAVRPFSGERQFYVTHRVKCVIDIFASAAQRQRLRLC
jgi:hypothetical protein